MVHATPLNGVGANLTPICELVRRWNNVHSHRIDSFHIEVMAASMFCSVGSNHRDALKSFFEWGYRFEQYEPRSDHRRSAHGPW